MGSIIDRPVALVILDGWGSARQGVETAITRARTPFFDHICRTYPKTELASAGQYVGLSAGAPGNAEAGHLNIGSGRAVQSEAVRIQGALQSGEFFENEVLLSAMRSAADRGTGLHLIGLLSDGGVHSSMESLYALLRMAKQVGVVKVYVHAILDGRDVAGRTADVYVELLELKMADIGVGRIGTLCGRFFAMDEGGNWERTARVFTMLIHADGERVRDAGAAVRNSFLRGLSDEFIAPIIIENDTGEPVGKVEEGDTIIFFNHRPESMRQLAVSVAGPGSDGIPNINAVCMVDYDRELRAPVAFGRDAHGVSLGSVLAESGVANHRIAEASRFPHVTRLLNGGIESVGGIEHHFMVPPAETNLRDFEPEMQSFKVADRVLRTMETYPAGLFIANISAADAATASGNPAKIVEAVQFSDTCLEGVVNCVVQAGGTVIVTSSHSNRGFNLKQIDAHDLSVESVPFHLIGEGFVGKQLRSGSLEDVAPTILGVLGIDKPAEMTGSDLRQV